MSARPLALLGARLIDPGSGYDGPGALLVRGDTIAEVALGADPQNISADFERIDCQGLALAPGLVDLRVKTGEPGSETRETLESASAAAAAGGVTSMVVQPDTDPPIDDPAVADFILRRARDIGVTRVLPAGAATKGLHGKAMAEIGLLAEAGCAYFTDTDRPIADSRLMRRLLTYARGLGLTLAHRPADPWLSSGTSASEGELALRLGLPAQPMAAETIMLERDLALVELTGAPLIVDQVSGAASLRSLARAKAEGLPVLATVSINHLCCNELDIGDYRTFCKLVPPLRSEEDREALVAAMADGLIDIVVSAHAPAPAEDKRLPFEEATPGSVGLETLLSALCTLHHEQDISLARLFEAASLAPARAIGLAAGRLAAGARADLVLFDPNAPRVIEAAKLISRSRNSAFDGRTLQGEVRFTVASGRIVYGDPPC